MRTTTDGRRPRRRKPAAGARALTWGVSATTAFGFLAALAAGLRPDAGAQPEAHAAPSPAAVAAPIPAKKVRIVIRRHLVAQQPATRRTVTSPRLPASEPQAAAPMPRPISTTHAS